MNPLWRYIEKFYTAADYAALEAQRKKWSNTLPLKGKKILDATPVFRNTLIKYAVLLDAGADLTIAVGENIPFAPEVLRLAPEFGIRVADEAALREEFDAVADCAGRHIKVKSRCGYAELTRSGLEYYRDADFPVFSVDSGLLKRFETTIGTGKSFVRAMKELHYDDFSGKKVTVFGGGKVGRGTAYFAALAGADTVIVDKNPITPPPGTSRLDAAEKSTVINRIKDSWCVVSATGLAGVLAEYVPFLENSSALIANMGVEDEFGSGLSPERVLNNKKTLNFILDEPTETRCIDPSMALSNEALLLLVQKKVAPGINLPPRELEMAIIADIRRAGVMNREIELILSEDKL